MCFTGCRSFFFFIFKLFFFFFLGLQRYSVESDVAELRVEANPQSCGISFQS